MKKDPVRNIALEDYLGCFGDFSFEDQICRKFCALRLRCAIEREQNVHLEMLDDLVSTAGMVIKVQ